ncbi:hypothetical protein ACFVGM_34285 [Kitasatospora purpeofusca]|uniref:hypothetical protein n=1 Tax=Kitasatospora purpeofusca TaxID=67352 RepID=UPI0036BD0A9C
MTVAARTVAVVVGTWLMLVMLMVPLVVLAALPRNDSLRGILSFAIVPLWVLALVLGPLVACFVLRQWITVGDRAGNPDAPPPPGPARAERDAPPPPRSDQQPRFQAPPASETPRTPPDPDAEARRRARADAERAARADAEQAARAAAARAREGEARRRARRNRRRRQQGRRQ